MPQSGQGQWKLTNLGFFLIKHVYFFNFDEIHTLLTFNIWGMLYALYQTIHQTATEAEAYKKYAIRNKALIYLVAVANNRIRPKALISSIT